MDASIGMFEAHGLSVGGGWDAQSASGFVAADRGSVTDVCLMLP